MDKFSHNLKRKSLLQDTFKTLASESFGDFRDRGSKFLAYAESIETVENAKLYLEKVKKLHPKARHFCYAYRLGIDGNDFRSNDDGEPSGTAGKPILGQIDKFELTNLIIIVVRYFGGTKLGTSGLINAYKLAAREAISTGNVVKKIVCDIFRVQFDYAIMSQVMNAQKKLRIEVAAQNFDAHPSIDLKIRRSEVETTLLNFRARVAQLPVEMVKDMEKIDGLVIEKIE